MMMIMMMDGRNNQMILNKRMEVSLHRVIQRLTTIIISITKIQDLRHFRT